MAIFGSGGFFGSSRIPDPTGMDLNAQLTNKLLFDEPGPQDTAGVRPQWQNPTNILDWSGRVADEYKLRGKGDVGWSSNLEALDKRLQGINLNKEGLEAIRKRSLTAGPSEWAALMEQKQRLEEGAAKEEAGAREASSRSESFSDLARKGGLSSGARERLATSGSRNYAKSLQDIAREGQAARLGISTEDERQKLDLLKGLPGMEVNALNPEFEKASAWSNLANSEAVRKQNLDIANRDYATGLEKYNLENTLKALGEQDQARMSKYEQDMKAYAAAKQADATANSGKDKGGKK